MSRVNGATDALSIGPSVGYILFLVIVHLWLEVETGLCSKKTIAPGCRGSRSRGGRGRDTPSDNLFFERGRRSSVNDRRGDTKGTSSAERGPSCFFPCPGGRGAPPWRTHDNARFCASQGGRTCDRIEGVSVGPTEKTMAVTDPAMKMVIQPKGWQI
jgi:hypothetical protein